MTTQKVRVRRRSRRGGCVWATVAALWLLAILIFIVGAGVVWWLPREAERRFGPPAHYLSQGQVVRYSAVMVWKADELVQPASRLESDVQFEITINESTQSIIQRLWQGGLISDPAAFRTYLQYTGLDTTLQAGRYTFSPHMTPVEIAQAMQDATPKEVTLGVLTGWPMEEIAETLPTSGLAVTPEEFLQAAYSRPAEFPFTVDLPAGASLEGFFFPDNYVLPRESSAQAVVNAMLANFDAQVGSTLRERYAVQGLSLFEAVTLASMVEREAVVEDDMSLIASVFYNRLAVGMKLDSDPTVQYALGYNAEQETWWTNPLSIADLNVTSPYNTYRFYGLPPGPIANPSLPALRAVAFPAQTPYYYFRAGCDGSGTHLFAETFQEHLLNACP